MGSPFRGVVWVNDPSPRATKRGWRILYPLNYILIYFITSYFVLFMLKRLHIDRRIIRIFVACLFLVCVRFSSAYNVSLKQFFPTPF